MKIHLVITHVEGICRNLPSWRRYLPLRISHSVLRASCSSSQTLLQIPYDGSLAC